MLRNTVITLVALALFAPTCNAQPLFAVTSDYAGGYSPMLEVGIGVTYDVIVLLNSDGEETSAVEFVMTDLVLLAPGVFKLGTELLGNPPIDLSIRPPGEFIFVYGHCEPAGEEIELARITYGNFGGIPGADTVLSIRGFEPGDSIPSSFGGSPGVVDCADNLLPGSMGGREGGCSGAIGQVPDGTLLINATPFGCPAGENSLGAVKCRY